MLLEKKTQNQAMHQRTTIPSVGCSLLWGHLPVSWPRARQDMGEMAAACMYKRQNLLGFGQDPGPLLYEF